MCVFFFITKVCTVFYMFCILLSFCFNWRCHCYLRVPDVWPTRRSAGRYWPVSQGRPVARVFFNSARKARLAVLKFGLIGSAGPIL